MQIHQLFIDGAWTPAETGATIEITLSLIHI